MLLDGREIPQGSVVDGDICILGAGAAGLSFAMEFAGSDTKIVVVESGGLEFDDDVNALNEGEGDLQLTRMRQRYFGGSTNCWGGRCAPLNEIDFEKRDWVPHSGWPITRNDLDYFYERACTFLGLGPYQQFFSQSWDREIYTGQFFHSFKSADSKIVGLPFIQALDPFLRFGPRFETKAKNSENLSIYLYSNAVSISPIENGSRIEDVEIRTLRGNTFSVRARYFVLALGGIENPRLLLASNTVESAGVGNRNDLVGRYFLTHPITFGGEVIYRGDQFCYDLETADIERKAVFFKVRDDIQREKQILGAAAEFWPVIPEPEAAFRMLRRDIFSGHVPVDLGKRLLKMMEDLPGVAHTAACQVQYKRNPHKSWYFKIQSESDPDPENRITLGHEKDALGMNKVRAVRVMDDLVRRSYVEMQNVLAAEVSRFGLGRVKTNEDLQAFEMSGDGNPEHFDLGHDMGTTRMSDSPRSGVVDAQCRVHGIDNLYIAGSSVFPTGGFVNPTMTIIALALRMADHIKERIQ